MSQLPHIAPSAIAIYLFAMLALLTFVSACAKRGSDHFFYQYYVDCIRANRRQLLFRFPNFVNPTRVMDPQLIYLCLSFLPRRSNDACALLLNPVVTTAMLAAFYLGVREVTHDDQIAAVTTILTSAIPQYYYIGNSRLNGLSGRGVGMLLFLLLMLVGLHGATHGGPGWKHLAVGSGLACLIIFSNIFALQGLCLIGLVMALLFREFFLVGALLGGVALFFAFSVRYASHYLVGLWGFWNRYRTELAERFILLQRPSVYRDFMWDFFLRVLQRSGKGGALLYAYSNPLIVVTLLSPVAMLIGYLVWGTPSIWPLSPTENWAIQVTFSAMAVCLATSFRALRFLGEPDRYVELAAPLGVLAMVSVSMRVGSNGFIAAVFAYFVLADLSQAFVSVLLKMRARDKGQGSLDALRSAIRSSALREEVVLLGNNANTMKSLLNTEWKFVFYWPSEASFAGFTFAEAFPQYPYLAGHVVSELVQRYEGTHVVIDKLNGCPLPANLADRFQLRFQDKEYELWQRR